MRFSFALFFGTTVLLSSCRTQPQPKPKMYFHQPYGAWILDGQETMTILRAMDEGDIHKVRDEETTRLLVTLEVLEDMDAHSQSDHLKKREEVNLARDTLDYMLAHRDEFDPRLPSVQAGVRAMQKILTTPDDVQRLKELTDHYAKMEKNLQKP